MYGQHPCFDKEAHHKYGRLHLPVAPKCNIQCVFCKREFDCPNESRPGVCSRIETPTEAAERAKRMFQTYPELKVIGIAGPGDPLANKETFETLEKVRDLEGRAKFCLSTNGLYLPEKIKELKELGVKYLTVTMNAASSTVGAKLYTYVKDHGNRLDGEEGAKLLLERQQEGIRAAVELGFYVKVNMVLVKEINTSEVETVANLLSEWGVHKMNMNSVINIYKNPVIQEVTREELKILREKASHYLPQIDFCKQCRADAVGIPGAEDARGMERIGGKR